MVVFSLVKKHQRWDKVHQHQDVCVGKNAVVYWIYDTVVHNGLYWDIIGFHEIRWDV